MRYQCQLTKLGSEYFSSDPSDLLESRTKSCMYFPIFEREYMYSLYSSDRSIANLKNVPLLFSKRYEKHRRISDAPKALYIRKIVSALVNFKRYESIIGSYKKARFENRKMRSGVEQSQCYKSLFITDYSPGESKMSVYSAH
jgi:hypothetical protein